MLKIFRDSVLRVSRSLGYDIVPLREMKERDFALHLGELLARLEIDCVLDVGANVGRYHDFLRDKVLFGGLIVSFEPTGRHVGRLRERARDDPNWHVEPYGLTVKTLDTVLPALRRRLGFRRPYLKLDTQGFDREVMEGARGSLAEIPALQSEVSVLGIYKGMPGYMDTIHYLGERGFDITGVYPASRDRALRLIEFDCVMINRAMAADQST